MLTRTHIDSTHRGGLFNRQCWSGILAPPLSARPFTVINAMSDSGCSSGYDSADDPVIYMCNSCEHMSEKNNFKWCGTCGKEYCPGRCFGGYANDCYLCYTPPAPKTIQTATSTSQMATVSASGLNFDLDSALKREDIEKIVVEKVTRQDGDVWEKVEIYFKNSSASREEWRRITNA